MPVHLTSEDLENVLQHVWVTGPGTAQPGELLAGDTTPLTREQAQALAIGLARRSTPAEAFLRVAHGLDVAPSDQAEMNGMRTMESDPAFRARLTDLASRLREMDALGQDMAVLSLNPPGVQAYPAADAVPLAREFNDALAAIVRRHPGRFGGLATVTPQAPEAAATEIERAMGTLGLNGIMINSHTTGGHYLDEPRFAPLLAAAEASGAPVYLHPRVPSMLDAYRPYGLLGAIWGYQAEAGLHAMRRRHAFAAATAGAATPMPRLSLTPSEYFRRNFVLTTSGIDDQRTAIAHRTAERVFTLTG